MKTIIYLTIAFVVFGILMVSGALPYSFETFVDVFFLYLSFVIFILIMKYWYSKRNRAKTAAFWQWLRDDYMNRKDY